MSNNKVLRLFYGKVWSKQLNNNMLRVYAIWNEGFNAVEVTGIYLDGKKLWFTELKQEIKDLLCLEYTEDGYALSGRNDIHSLSDWCESSQLNLGASAVLAGGEACINIYLDALAPKSDVEEVGDTYSVIFRRTGAVMQEFKGFTTQLRAEMFLKRLWFSGTHLYFLDCTDDYLLSLPSDSTAEGRNKRFEVAACKGYGSMRWSLSNSNESESSNDDSFYFDYFKLPKWTGHIAVQCSLNCNSGHYVEDYECNIVRPEDLKIWARDIINSAIDWFAEREDTNWDAIRRDVERLKSVMYKQIDIDLAKWGYSK